METVNIYLESLYIEEFDFSKVIGKINPKTLIDTFKSKINEKDPKKTLEGLSKISVPNIEPEKIDKYMQNKITNYKKIKDRNVSIIKNSIPGVSNSIANSVSILATTLATLAPKKDVNKTFEENAKIVIKNVILKARSFMDTYEEEEKNDKKKQGFLSRIPVESLPDYVVALGLIFVVAGVSFVIGSGIIAVLTAIYGLFTGPGVFILAIIVVGIITLIKLLISKIPSVPSTIHL